MFFVLEGTLLPETERRSCRRALVIPGHGHASAPLPAPCLGGTASLLCQTSSLLLRWDAILHDLSWQTCERLLVLPNVFGIGEATEHLNTCIWI